MSGYDDAMRNWNESRKRAAEPSEVGGGDSEARPILDALYRAPGGLPEALAAIAGILMDPGVYHVRIVKVDIHG